jgi:hypothetical protein
MKRSALIVRTLLVALLALVCLSGVAPAGAMPSGAEARSVAVPAAGTGAPALVSYQGQVAVGGAPYAGAGYFKFAIVDGTGTTSYWSNDGTSSSGGEPDKPVQLVVSSGLFNVLLGDDTLTNMTVLPANTFDESDRWLRVWFSSDGTTFAQRSPDRRIAAAPYALQADMLDGQEASAFAVSTHEHDAAYVNEGQSNSVTAAMLVDGPSSGVDADLVDGSIPAALRPAATRIRP